MGFASHRLSSSAMKKYYIFYYFIYHFQYFASTLLIIFLPKIFMMRVMLVYNFQNPPGTHLGVCCLHAEERHSLETEVRTRRIRKAMPRGNVKREENEDLCVSHVKVARNGQPSSLHRSRSV